ncbi:hypothetical protein [Corynebacterium guaraldiae]|uniref:hypothetical protein n=1 Tax=Corynebacterium guaraldiae TaxID=3051103 RepID=UPI0032B01932
MLDPALLWENLLVLELADGHLLSVVIENDATRGGRTLVNRCNVALGGHKFLLVGGVLKGYG